MMGMARYVGLTRDPHPPPTPLYAQGHPSTLYALIHTFHHYPYSNTNVRIYGGLLGRHQRTWHTEAFSAFDSVLLIHQIWTPHPFLEISL